MYDLKTEPITEKLFPGFDTGSEWGHLRTRAAKTREMVEGVSRRFGTESSQSFDQLVTEEIVSALRAGEESEVLYWKLKYFSEAYRHAPVIKTDRGKLVYVLLNQETGVVSLVIGAASEIITIGRRGIHTHYVVPITERYDFVPYELIGAVARRHLDLNMLIDELAPDASVRECKVPVLMFSVAERGHYSEATLSCDLSIADHKRRNEEISDLTPAKIVVVVKGNADEDLHKTA